MGAPPNNPEHPFITELRASYAVTGDENGISMRDDARGLDFFGLRKERTSIDELLQTMDAAYLHGQQLKAIRKFTNVKGDYAPAANFNVEIDGVIQGGFKEVNGLESAVEVIEYRHGDHITGKRPGRPKFKNITLKRGALNNHSLYEWYKKVLSGTPERKSGSIIYIGRDGEERARYTLASVGPIRWMAPEQARAATDSDTHTVEEIEFVVEKVERAN